MGKTCRIIRRSVFCFLQNYQYFTSTPSLLAFPFALLTLVSQSLISSSSSLFPLVHTRISSLFLAAGFPPSSQLFTIFNLKLSQTILTFLLVSPFSLSFLLLAKASVIRTFDDDHGRKPTRPNSTFSWKLLFCPLLITHLCNTVVMLAANSTCFFLLVIFFNFSDFLGLSTPRTVLLLSATGALTYSIIIANAYIICNLALVSSGMEKKGGFVSILKACVLVQGRTITALTLAVTINVALTAIEVLFQYRVVRGYSRTMASNSALLLEGMLIAYLYALLLVLDIVVGCVFWRSCQRDQQIEILEADGDSFAKTKAFELIP